MQSYNPFTKLNYYIFYIFLFLPSKCVIFVGNLLFILSTYFVVAWWPGTKPQAFDDQKSRFSTQLSSSSSQTYKQEATRTLTVRESDNGASTTGASAAEYQSVANILSRTGIQKDTLVSFTNWFSPSHPLDPSIFQQLDNYSCNKRLLFHLVDELLADILKPYMNMKPWASSNGHGYNCRHMQGSQLIDTLCAKIRSFPSADCRVLEDIDGLIDKDLPKAKVESAMAFEEEGEEMVTEIEKDIMDTLVHEIVLEFWWNVTATCRGRTVLARVGEGQRAEGSHGRVIHVMRCSVLLLVGTCTEAWGFHVGSKPRTHSLSDWLSKDITGTGIRSSLSPSLEPFVCIYIYCILSLFSFSF